MQLLAYVYFLFSSPKNYLAPTIVYASQPLFKRLRKPLGILPKARLVQVWLFNILKLINFMN